MRLIIVLLAGVSMTVLSAQGTVLDARLPNGVSSGGSVSGPVRQLPVTVTITDLLDQTYVVGDILDYEVAVTNHGPTALLIPWTVDGAWSESTVDPVLEAAIALTLTNEAGQEQRVGATYMYGVSGLASTVRELQVGASARIRFRVRWSFRGVGATAYLGETGRMTARATYRLKRDGTMSSTPPSEPRQLTLALPQ